MSLALSTIRNARELVGDDWREFASAASDGEDDVHVGKYRFIHEDVIDDVLAEELENDEYVLGCFRAEFLSDVTRWPIALIRAAQKGEAYAALGRAIIDSGHTVALARAYSSADGYGHHFASCDGETHEIGDGWLAFRVD